MTDSNVIQKHVYEIQPDESTLKKADQALTKSGLIGVLDSDTLAKTKYGSQIKIVVEKLVG